MGKAYDPSARNNSQQAVYAVTTTGDNWFIPTTGYGDNPNSGTTAQRLTQCDILVGDTTDGTPAGVESVAS